MKTKDLPKPAKVAATHALKELDFTFEQIATTLGIGARSAERYILEPTDEEWQSFGTNIKKLVAVKEEEIAAKALHEIEEKMPQARFFELVGLYKIIRELQQPAKSVGVAVQVNLGDALSQARKDRGLE